MNDDNNTAHTDDETPEEHIDKLFGMEDGYLPDDNEAEEYVDELFGMTDGFISD